MSFELEFSRSVEIAPFISRNVYGTCTYGTPVTVPACIDYTIKNIKDFRGNDLITSAWIALPADFSINYQDQITLPNGEKPYIGSIDDAYDEEAREVLYKIIYVGRVAPGQGIL